MLTEIQNVQKRVFTFKEKAREFYFQVLLGKYHCPLCGEQDLQMAGPGVCICPSGHSFDPTAELQRSACCGAPLTKRVCHYVCADCKQAQASRFLFDERIFDAQYFRERMREHREKVERRKEEIRRLLAETRSDELILTEEPSLEAIPGLMEDLEHFISPEACDAAGFPLQGLEFFDYQAYRNHIISGLGWSPVLFTEISALKENYRKDKVWRFMALLFMAQNREIDMLQHGRDIQIQRLNHETD